MVEAGKNHPLYGKKFNPERSLYIMPETTIKQIMKEKLGELISLDIDKITISEFNTRCQFVDDAHVKTLMNSIEQNGYIPKSAVWINAVKGPDEEIITYRLVAGRHRYEATKRLGFNEIPSQSYYNLTDEEECELDDIDNKLDEHHKPINFLDIAEHYKYLQKIKKWSIRQIARAKNVSKSDVERKLQIANLSDDVKNIIKPVPHGGHFTERHFREICKLSSIPHQILICKEIIASRTEEEDSHKKFPELKSIPGSPMSQKDIEGRIVELLEIEQNGKIAPEAEIFATDKLPSDLSETIITSTPSDKKPEQLEFDIFSEISDERFTQAKPREFRFSILPLWIRHTDLINNMSPSSYLLLNELITYDFRYKPDKDKFFFISHYQKYDKCTDFLAHMAGVKENTLNKKILPEIKEYINYRKVGEKIDFQIKWNKLYEIYKEHAKEIPFDDGGLFGIPEDFSGWLRPTPYHSIYIENGKVMKYKNKSQKNETEPEEKEKKYQKQEKSITAEPDSRNTTVPRITQAGTCPLSQKLKDLGIAEQQIPLCLQKKEKTEDVLKYFNEMPPAEKDKLHNIPGFIYTLVMGEFKPPEGFISAKAAANKKERKKRIEELAALIEEKFRNKKITYFSPEEGIKYPLRTIPNNQTFLYTNRKGLPTAATFAEWADIKFFC